MKEAMYLQMLKVTLSYLNSLLSTLELDVLKEITLSVRVDDNIPPVVHPPRKVPVPLRETLKTKLDNLVKHGIVAKLTEPTSWVSSLVIVKKPNGKKWVCLNPRDLNRAIKPSHYPLPTIEEVSTRLSCARVFRVLDATCGFWQVRLN